MKAKVLLVEDDYLSRVLMQEFCRGLGADCEIVSHGHQCLELLASGTVSFDLILMDIHMPRLSGLDTTRAIRCNPANPARDLPIVAVTADLHWHKPENYEAAGFDSVLRKPVEVSELEALLSRYAPQETKAVDPTVQMDLAF